MQYIHTNKHKDNESNKYTSKYKIVGMQKKCKYFYSMNML